MLPKGDSATRFPNQEFVTLPIVIELVMFKRSFRPENSSYVFADTHLLVHRSLDNTHPPDTFHLQRHGLGDVLTLISPSPPSVSPVLCLPSMSQNFHAPLTPHPPNPTYDPSNACYRGFHQFQEYCHIYTGSCAENPPIGLDGVSRAQRYILRPFIRALSVQELSYSCTWWFQV